ncbi:hypothetical protein [Salicibibacter kimchii]|uniref:Uncharacterized protein n=1 Tax=Salicibibacter kimchii TaxID=2099786 RepID=A0A345BVV1_9BACI|nr:hypothetical protein [Salicibibacter kimchii]AXF55082.1 hypothetical protein DT065_02990 [Salicibibacter kimchii]
MSYYHKRNKKEFYDVDHNMKKVHVKNDHDNKNRNDLDNENFLKDKNYNVNHSEVKNSGNAYVDVHVDSEALARLRAKTDQNVKSNQSIDEGGHGKRY